MFIFHPGNREIPVELTDRKVDNINQTNLIMLLCVAIFLMPILSLAVEQNQRPNRVNVSFTTLQEAINNANAGHTILVPAGIYYERARRPNWNLNADLKADEIIDIYDAIVLANHYDQHE